MVVLVGMVLVPPAEAHESRPAYLQIRQVAANRYSVLWRTPINSGQRLLVALRFPSGVRSVSDTVVQEFNDSRIERWSVESDSGAFGGQRIEFPGLQATITDVLVRIQMLDGTQSTTLIHPSRPWVVMSTARSRTQMALAYLAFGVQHIVFGFDHLLFVLGLLLLVRGVGPLLKTITAFTVAHSITLALATLGVVHVPPPPVEAVIALSIVFLASELIKQQRGVVGLAQRYPWVIAFAFGLLHGFGFAGMLTQLGIPSGDVPLALFMFNLGVELGQLGFVAAIMLVWALVRRLRLPWPRWTRLVPGYAIGGMAAFWLVERIVGML